MHFPKALRPEAARAVPATLALVLAALAVPQGAAAEEFTSGYVQVVTGDFHSCALRHDGQVWCWGAGRVGQLGNGGTEDSLVPVRVRSPAAGFGPGNIAFLAANGLRTCALNRAGRAFCWGSNAFGELGDGTTETRTRPVAVSRLGNGVQALSVGFRHVCAVNRLGRAFCWGSGGSGRLGDGTTETRTRPTPVDTGTPGFNLRNIATVAAGETHSCAINANGRTFCWGGPLLLGTGDSGDSLVPVPVDTAAPGFNRRNLARVEAGGQHSCAVNAAGRTYCWGRNAQGQLGTGAPGTDALSPRPVRPAAVGFGRNNIARVVAGFRQNCALNEAGRAFCWGANAAGQLGDGSATDRAVPVRVRGLGTGLRDIASGFLHSCAIDAAGDVWCWGSNGSGRLGDGTTTARNLPVRVVGLP